MQRKTDRLILRPLKLSDYKIWKATYLGLKKAKNRWDLGPKDIEELSREDFKKILNYQRKKHRIGSHYEFGIFTNKGELIGKASLMDVIRGVTQSAYLAYRIFNSHWGHGYAREAASAIIDMAFFDLKLHRIEVGIEPQNQRSIKVAKALKMRPEGLKKRMVYLRQKWVDLRIFAITAEEVNSKWKMENFSNF